MGAVQDRGLIRWWSRGERRVEPSSCAVARWLLCQSLRKKAQDMSRFQGRKGVSSVWVRLNRKGHSSGVVLESQRSTANKSWSWEKKIHSAFPRIKHLNQTDFILALTGLQFQKKIKKKNWESWQSHSFHVINLFLYRNGYLWLSTGSLNLKL